MKGEALSQFQYPDLILFGFFTVLDLFFRSPHLGRVCRRQRVLDFDCPYSGIRQRGRAT